MKKGIVILVVIAVIAIVAVFWFGKKSEAPTDSGYGAPETGAETFSGEAAPAPAP